MLSLRLTALAATQNNLAKKKKNYLLDQEYQGYFGIVGLDK